MITIYDKKFDFFMTAEEVQAVIRRLADEISNDMRDLDPIFCPVLSGSFLFAADLVRKLDFDPEISFVKFSSYDGLQSTGQVKELIGFPDSVRGRHVLIVEDIIETGISMAAMLKKLYEKEPASVKVCTLMHKPDLLQCDVQMDYIGREIPNAFIVGYGFDYNGHGRTYPDIYSLSDAEE
ncbi:MAG: hypoxanthine phosphoribosyltransferase [Bacteroidales bacterium]|nr:hypoxanthine phosphoribosyltransferase [Bacteroidales bacterium]